MRIKLSYKEPDQSKESIKWLKEAEKSINDRLQKQVEEYATFDIIAIYEDIEK